MGQAPLQDPKFGPDPQTREKCVMNTSLYQEYYKQNNLKDAVNPWRIVFNICPASSQNLYIRGVKIMKYRIENETDPVKRMALIDTLMLLYDKRIEHFNKKGAFLGQKGTDLIALAPEKYEAAFKIVEESVNIDKEASEAAVLYTYMVLTKTMYENQKLQAEKVIELYSSIMDLIEKQIAKNPNEDKVKQVKDGIDALFAGMGVANCDNLIALFTPRFQATPEDLNLNKKIKALMGANKCTDKELYRNACINIFKAEPSAALAIDIAHILIVTTKDYKKAETYYNEAINLEENPQNRAEYLWELASITYNEFKNPTQARALAYKALEANPGMGKAYKLIGDMYARESNCGADDFEKKTVYWAAVDKYSKAKQVDPELADEMDGLINTYMKYFPAKDDIFFHDLTIGDTYTVGCWMGEKTTIRARP